MKLVSLAVVLFGGALAFVTLCAHTSYADELDGKKVVVRMHPTASDGRRVKVEATIRGGAIEFPLANANGSTVFSIYSADQSDETVKEFFSGQVFQWRFNEGPPYLLPLARDELQNRSVAVRIYPVGCENPTDYRSVTLRVDDGKIRFELEQEDGAVFVVIFGSDQQDEIISSVLGNRIYGWPYEKGSEFTLPRFVGKGGQNPCVWSFADAVGNVVARAHIKLYLFRKSRATGTRQALVAAGKLDDLGQPTDIYCRGRGYAQRETGIPTAKFRFVISHPNYDTLYVEPEGYSPPEALFVPSVPADSNAAGRCIWGTVVDPNGAPISGAMIRGIAVIPMGGNWIRTLRGQRHGAVTDEHGRFRMYLLPEEGAFEVGILVPPKTEYQVSIEPPPGRNLMGRTTEIMNGRETEVVLEYAGYFHTFAFEDANGPITDLEVLSDISVVIKRPGKYEDHWFWYEQWKDGGRFPLGTFTVSHKNLRFEHVAVTAESPERIVFKLRPERLYQGRVTHGVTGEPMVGALVIAAGKCQRQNNLAYVDSEEWDTLHKLRDQVLPTDEDFQELLRPLRIHCSINGLVRSSEEGRFEIALPNNVKTLRIAALEENFLPFYAPIGWAKQDEHGDYELPDLKLFPAAKVVLRPVFAIDPNHPLSLRVPGFPLMGPDWFIDKEKSPAWADELLAACCEQADEGIYRGYELAVVKIQGDYRSHRLLVPAGVSFRLNLRSLNNIEWAPITVGDGLMLEQGQLVDLGRHKIVEPFGILVEVLNSSNGPVEGIPVVVSGGYDPAVSNTDEEGVALFDFVGYSKGEFIVEHKGENYPQAPKLRQSIPYEISGVEDANNVYTLQLSDEMLKALFK
ncbi:MAG: hypothetical protein ACYTBJ_15980 [Planctomycetota bacterium]|jgi:hypothetical protein